MASQADPGDAEGQVVHTRNEQDYNGTRTVPSYRLVFSPVHSHFNSTTGWQSRMHGEHATSRRNHARTGLTARCVGESGPRHSTCGLSIPQAL